MSIILRIAAAFFVLVLVSSPLTLAAPPEPDAKSLELFERVQAEYAATRAAVRSIEYTYVYDINGMRREARYARLGDNHYHASLERDAEGSVSLPCETTWNGQRAWYRSRLDYIKTSRNEDDSGGGCPTIESSVNSYIAQAYNIEPRVAASYPFRGAVEEMRDGKRFIIVTCDAPWCQGKLIIEHACDSGYWPSRVLVKDGADVLRYEMSNVKFVHTPRNGKELFFPVEIEQVAEPTRNPHNTMHVKLDVNTLRINEPIAMERFTLVPWPNEIVADFDKQSETPAADPKWVPDERVGFPFNEVMREK